MTNALRLHVTGIVDEAVGIKSFELRALDGGQLPAFSAGSHIDLHLAEGLRRSYSLLNAPSETDRYVVGVSLASASRGGSSHMHEKVTIGTVIEATPPRNNFALFETAAHSVLIGGGIGITPLIAMMHRLREIDIPWELHLAARSRAHTAFLPMLDTGDARINVRFDEDHAGRPLPLAGLISGAPEGTHFYCCGPSGMMDAFKAATAHLPPERVHFEYFSSDVAPATDGGFELELARSGKRVTVPGGSTILDVLLDNGVDIDYSCMEGTCGTCLTRVLAGIPDHRDLYLTEAEQDSNEVMMICCSGCKSPKLVLDR